MRILLIIPAIIALAACCPDDARCGAAKHPAHITGPGIDCVGTVEKNCTGHHCEWTITCQDGRTYFNASNFTIGN